MTELEAVKTCDLCGAQQWAHVLSGPDRLLGGTVEFGVQRCGTCGLLVTSPRPSARDIARFYPVGEYYAYQVADKSEMRVETLLKRLVRECYLGYPRSREGLGRCSRHLLRPILFPIRNSLPHIPPYVHNGTLLDVGCGAGDYLATVRDLGWDPYGVDISSSAIAHCRRNFGDDHFHEGDIESAGFPDNFFDVVNMSHVLEHAFSPTAVLRSASRLLKPGGTVIVRLPNAAGLHARCFSKDWFAWELPRHLYHFSQKTLHRLMRAVGFEAIRFVFPPAGYILLASLRYRIASRFGRVLPFERNPALLAITVAYGTVLSRAGATDYMQATARKPL